MPPRPCGANLQEAILEHKLESLHVYVFEYVNVTKLSPKERKLLITTVEQKYIDSVPSDKQYNLIGSRKL